MLKDWSERFQNENPRRREIETGRLSSTTATDPAASLEYLRGRTNVAYNHTRITPDARPDLAMKLDPSLISWDQFLETALANTESLGKLTTTGLMNALRNGKVELTVPRRRDLLNRIHRPDFPNLVKIINDDLGTEESKGFGEFAIHGKLTLGQLEDLLKLRPALLLNSNSLLHGPASCGLHSVRTPCAAAAVREAWLDRLEAFTARLAPSFNSLKAHVLFHRLVHDQAKGVINEAKLLAYLRLPRPVGYVAQKYRESDVFKQPVDLNANYEPLSGCAPIGNDEGLVRSLLLTVLAKPTRRKKYAPFLNDQWLNALHAEAMLLRGAADAQDWVSKLSPEAYQALRTE